LIFSLLSYDVTRSGRDLVLALCAALLACNLKFTGPVYTALILLPFAVWWLFERRLVARDLLICGIAALVLLAASVNPYFTNLRDFGSPVYPLNSQIALSITRRRMRETSQAPFSRAGSKSSKNLAARQTFGSVDSVRSSVSQLRLPYWQQAY
jgi:hypothetical protein